MNHYAALKKLMPLNLGEVSDVDMAVEGATLDAASEMIGGAVAEWFPSSADTLLSRWEAEYGVLPKTGDTAVSRHEALSAAYRAVGNLKKQHFVSIASALGYMVTITEGGEQNNMFRVGITTIPAPLFSPVAMWVWTVTTTNKPAGDDIKTLFEELSPPHMKLLWAYSPT